MGFLSVCVKSFVTGAVIRCLEAFNGTRVGGSDWKQLLVCWTYESSDAASAHSGLEVTLQLLLDGTGGVKALGQKDDGVDEEKGGDAVDDVLEDLDAEPKIPMLQTLQEASPNCSHCCLLVYVSA